jgi:hypothetical protein
MARMNCAALEVQAPQFILADVRHIRPRADAIFIDPARRESTGRRVRRGACYSPPLSFAQELQRTVGSVAVKVSPVINESELPSCCEVEFISAGGECREAVLYFGPLSSVARRATILPGGHSLTSETGPHVPVGLPGTFIYDPDPAVVRAHLLDVLARRLDAWKLDPRIAYLSGDSLVYTPFTRTYRLLKQQPFHLKRLRQLLIGEGFRPDEIKKRRFPMAPEEVRRRLKIRSGTRPVTLILTRLDSEPVCMICEKLSK